jgi:hypothetical protein
VGDKDLSRPGLTLADGGYCAGMWLLYIAFILIAAGIVAAFAGGGIFSIVAIPVGVVVLVAGLLAARRRGPRAADARPASDPAGTGPRGASLPHQRTPEPHRVETTPDALVRARQQEQ